MPSNTPAIEEPQEKLREKSEKRDDVISSDPERLRETFREQARLQTETTINNIERVTLKAKTLEDAGSCERLEELKADAAEELHALEKALDTDTSVREEESSDPLGEAFDLLEAHLSGSVTDTARLIRLTKNEEVGEKIRAELETHLTEQFQNERCDFEKMSRLIALLQHQEDGGEFFRTQAENSKMNLGPNILKTIFEQPDYRQELQTLQNRLEKPLRAEGPVLCRKTSLENLIALRETWGEDWMSMAKVFDLKRLESMMATKENDASPSIRLQDKTQGTEDDVIRITKVIGLIDRDDEGNLDVSKFENITIRLGQAFEAKLGTTKKATFIEREFTFTPHPEDVQRLVTEVHHIEFQLPRECTGNGLAARMLRDSVQMYQHKGIDSIKTTAQHDLGSYAWQAFGFRFDRSAMDHDKIKDCVEACKERVTAALRDANLLDLDDKPTSDEVAHLLNAYQFFYDHPEEAEPHKLASIGQDSSIRLKRLRATQGTQAYEEWISPDMEETWRKKQNEKGREVSTIPEKRGEMHLGKIGLLDGVYFAQLPLRGESFETLQAKLAASGYPLE